HLMTHAFFKALLFLAAGSVIHGLGGEQDLRKMGGLRKYMPVTFWTMTAAVLTIAGTPFLAAFYSKDAILYAAFLHGNSGKVFWFIGLVTAMLTSFYMFRLWYLTFLGERRSGAHELESHGAAVHSRSDSRLVLEAEHSHTPHESPWSMLGPLVILALLSISGGWIGMERFGHYLAPATGALATEGGSATLEYVLAGAAVLVALIGWLIADRLYRSKPASAAQLAASFSGPYKLLLNKYWVDEFYGAVIVKPILATSRFVLEWVVDVAILGGAAWLLGGICSLGGAILQRWQSGNLRSYAAWLTAAATVILIYVLWIYSPSYLSSFINHGTGH
ncbi:MAG TPA: proton-conducting transporter membrane subunit, partial [Terracidiphilus sp.]|nr:proton-conducting transporter membrane subunit [Terracidiphilus sp.]